MLWLRSPRLCVANRVVKNVWCGQETLQIPAGFFHGLSNSAHVFTSSIAALIAELLVAV